MKNTGEKEDLKLLKNHEINFIKWDNCINNAHNGSLYAFSWYLDIISENWVAIVQKNYQAVMPLILKKKSGIPYITTSLLANQLGVFSTYILDKETVNEFIERVNKRYKLFRINLNKFNKLDSCLFRQFNNNTYEFDLIRNYSIMKDAYSPYIHSRLDKARKNKVSVIRGLLPNEFINFLRNRSVMASGRLNRDTINKLRRIIAFAINHSLGEIYAAYSSKNELCAAVLFLKSNRKVHLLFSGISKDGIHEGAMALLIDRFIEKNTEKNLTLNFENLVIPGKEEFFTGFGASKYHYKTIKNPRNFLFNPLTGGHNHSFF